MRAGQDFRALTGLRGVAAIYVMMFHYAAGLPLLSPETTLIAHGYLAVDLFFVLSGFVMALTYGGMFHSGWSWPVYRKFLGRRVARIYPLYAATLIIACILMASGLMRLPVHGSVVTTFIPNLLMVQSWDFGISLDGPAWSISAEWAAYLLFPLILVPCLFSRPWLAWLVTGVSIAVLATLCTLSPRFGDKPFPDALLDISQPALALPVLRCLAEFALGVVTYRLSVLPIGLLLADNRWVALGTCTALAVLLAVPRADLAVVVLLPVLVLSLTSDRHIPGRVLTGRTVVILGQLSYSIYLIHALMGGLLGSVHGAIDRLGWRHGQTYAAAAGMLATLPCAYLAYRFLELPGRQWLRRAFENERLVPVDAEPSAP